MIRQYFHSTQKKIPQCQKLKAVITKSPRSVVYFTSMKPSTLSIQYYPSGGKG